MSLYCVITTIQEPTTCVVNLSNRLNEIKANFIIVGDQKSPAEYELQGADYYNLPDQLDLPFKLSEKLPLNHYSRKNLGYLVAIASKATCIYETDDDNEPLAIWHARSESLSDIIKVGLSKEFSVTKKGRWLNVYKNFSSKNIWPRGFPLDEINSSQETSELSFVHSKSLDVRSPIQQGLVNNSPDVDAIWRLLFGEEFNFEPNASVYLSPGSWCPFNTQSTWWWPIAYPLLYIPSYCPFRMCDIWKSFVAQRCIWELGLGVTFHAAEVIQNRNEHNLMSDFEDEVDGYLINKKIIAILESTSLSGDVGSIGDNLYLCYENLVRNKIFPHKELALVECWLSGLKGQA